jgi:hypothetical protein
LPWYFSGEKTCRRLVNFKGPFVWTSSPTHRPMQSKQQLDLPPSAAYVSIATSLSSKPQRLPGGCAYSYKGMGPGRHDSDCALLTLQI